VDILLARQPIFGSNLQVYGYELLYRACHNHGGSGSDGTVASMQVLANVLLTFGPARVLGGKVGFINFTRELLVSDLAYMLPWDSLVIEILETVVPDEPVIAACRKLKDRHYRLALDDFVDTEQSLPLVELANIIKVDFRSTPERERLRLVRSHARPGLRFLAEKVETSEEFEWARKNGFDYFQGFFLARPSMMARKEIPALKINTLRLLAQVHRRELDFGEVEELIKRDAPLCYRLLRYVNSGAFALPSRISSIRQAMMILGEEDMRKWIALAAIPALASDKPNELLERATLRARFCELLAPWAGPSPRGSELFLAGMFSLLDAMVGRPLGELLEELGLTDTVGAVLLGQSPAESGLSQVYRLALACEDADWDAVLRIAKKLRAPVEVVSDLYVEAVDWCVKLLRDSARRRDAVPARG